MSLSSGTRLDPYEIFASIGARGMGEGYVALSLARLHGTAKRKDGRISVPICYAVSSGRIESFKRYAPLCWDSARLLRELRRRDMKSTGTRLRTSLKATSSPALLLSLCGFGYGQVVTVPGTADIHLAGQPYGTVLWGWDEDPDSVPENSPSKVEVAAGAKITITATGLTCNCPGCCATSPDGGQGEGIVSGGAHFGLSSLDNFPINSLVGVFLGPGIPDVAATPPALNQPQGFTSAAPLLQQVFFIGAGPRTLIVPAGATCLYLGSADSPGTNANNSGAFTVSAQSTGTFTGAFTATGNMTTPRDQHTATLLPSGRVLIAGGEASTALGTPPTPLASAELYDPSTGTFSPTGNMTTTRRLHTATLLADGRVLIAGGRGSGNDTLASAELYDPLTGTFSATGAMTTARLFHTATLLNDGRVLMTGGVGPASTGPVVANAELYDPSAGAFTPTGAYAGAGICDFCPPATLLTDGKTLFTWQQPAQLYDPATGAFSRTGAMIDPDHSTATLLENGTVLFTGGESVGRSSSAELYDPATGTFTSTANMRSRRVWQTATLLPGGMALVAGGETDACTANFCMFAGSVASAELYDPSTGTFAATADMTARREVHQATLLNDGRVLITGGVYYGGIGIFFGSLSSAELYVPPVLVPTPVLLSVSGDGRGQGAILHADTHQVVSSNNPTAAGEALEMYLTGLADGSKIPPQVAIGGRMAEVLFFGKAPGFADLNQVNVRVPIGVSPGLAVTVRLKYLDRPSNEVTIGVR
jgi:galactose oxidase-like protein